MEILVRTGKYYWHFKGFKLFRKVTSWDWDKAHQTIDILQAQQEGKLEKDIDKTREEMKKLDAYVSRGAVEATFIEAREYVHSHAGGWVHPLDNTLPSHQEPAMTPWWKQEDVERKLSGE